MTVRQIPFAYSEQTKGIPFIYLDERQLANFEFHTEPLSRLLSMQVGETETPRLIDFSMGDSSTQIPFVIGIWDDVPAILGVLDPYTLGELDTLSIDFRMYEGINELITTDILGKGTGNIFEFEEPVHFLFYYRTDHFAIPFYLDKHFLGDLWYIGTKPVLLCLWNTDKGKKTETVLLKDLSNIHTVNYLVNRKSELLSSIVLRCKAILGVPNTLGECDPLTLGMLDPYILGELDRNIASILRLNSNRTIELCVGVSSGASHETMAIGADAVALQSSIVVRASETVNGLVSGRSVHSATLGELDPYNLLALDQRTIGMRTYGKVNAIVTKN